jgi:hypothetical protein
VSYSGGGGGGFGGFGGGGFGFGGCIAGLQIVSGAGRGRVAPPLDIAAVPTISLER